jgi:cytochrome c oxidase cbb3-type subunit 1
MATPSDMTDLRTPNDAASRGPLLLLLGSGAAWLVVSGALGIVASVQLHDPEFLADSPILTYGRVSSLCETAFAYGWLANAGLALALWVLGRLSGEPLRAQNWAVAGTLLWNAGVAAALAGTATGDATGFELLGLPPYVQLAMFFAYGAIAAGGLLAWTGRLRRVSFASHWYAVAALFAFPWILSVAHVLLFTAPVRGVMQAVVAGWYARSAWTLWIACLCLSAAYYVVPKATGRVLPSYARARLGFWCLILMGGLGGARHLVAGPVPAWMPSVAAASCLVLLVNPLVVVLNLRGAFRGSGAPLRFIAIGLGAYALCALADAATSFRTVAERTQFTLAEEAQRQAALGGAASMMLFGAAYFALPPITGRAWRSARLGAAHLALASSGLLILVASLCFAGAVQCRGLPDPQVPFEEILRQERPWLVAATAGRAILLLGNLAFLANLALTSCGRMEAPGPAPLAPPAPAGPAAP